MQVWIFTNGSQITEKWIQKIKKLDSEINMVIHFDSPSSYGKHTGRPKMFEKMVDAIRKCVEYDLTVVAFITLTKYNSKYIEDMVKSVIELGAYPFVERYIPVKDPETNKELEVDSKDLENASKLFREIYSDVSELYEYLSYQQRTLCGCYRSTISITYEGYVLPCPYLPKRASIGNIKDKSLNELWKEYKKQQKIWFKIPETCKKCDKKYLCGGGCKTYSYLKYNTMNEKDPLCTGEIPPTYCHIAFLAANLEQILASKSIFGPYEDEVLIGVWIL